MNFVFFIRHEPLLVILLTVFGLLQRNALRKRLYMSVCCRREFLCVCLFYLLKSPLNRFIEVSLTEHGATWVDEFRVKKCCCLLAAFFFGYNSLRRLLELCILHFLSSSNRYPLGDGFAADSICGLIINKRQLHSLVCELNLCCRLALLIVRSCEASVKNGLLIFCQLHVCQFVFFVCLLFFASRRVRNSIYPCTYTALWWSLLNAATDSSDCADRRDRPFAWAHQIFPVSISHRSSEQFFIVLLIDNALTFSMQSWDHFNYYY